MDEHEKEALRAAIELLHKCKASFVSSEVINAWPDIAATTRDVATFSFAGHATAELAYAWSDRTATQSVHYRVVLHAGPIRSSDAALRGFLLVHWPTSDNP